MPLGAMTTAFAGPVLQVVRPQPVRLPTCSRRPRMCVTASPSAAEQETSLLVGLVNRSSGRGMSDADRERVRLLVDCLVSAAPSEVQYPQTLGYLDGPSWNLVYSSENLPPPSIPLPFAVLTVVGVQQRFDTAERMLDNVVLLRFDVPGRSSTSHDFEFTVRNSFDVSGSDSLDVTIQSAGLRIRSFTTGGMRDLLPALSVGSIADRLSQFTSTSRKRTVRVTTTYIGSSIRIASADDGALRIFARDRL